MPAWFYNLHVVTALFLIYAVFGTIGFIAYKLNKKYFKLENHSPIITVAQQTSITFGTLFIAFWIALNWQTLDNLSLDSKSEAQAILDLYSSTHAINQEPQANNVRNAIENYLNSIVTEEYKSLEQGELNQHTGELFNQLKIAVYHLPAKTLEEKITYYHITTSLNTLVDFRFKRLDYVNGQMNGVLLIFFVVLLAIICFWSACINNHNRKLSVLVLCSQYLIILSSSWLILEIDRPFQGYFKVDNSAFVQIQQQVTQLNYTYNK
ncbi:MAG: DUF4239 domain-containing protein [Neisseriales bacterium]|jgi:hypothetical protein|nr:MAG: DUF4239 domain-containing protein [Neisseriales bacterium]